MARIIRTIDGRHFNFDLAQLRAADLEGDLRGRDFTCNAMAVPLAGLTPHDTTALPLIDPLGGREHLLRRELHPCSDLLFVDDPVRIMRAFRFGAQLEATLSPVLQQLMQRDCARLATVSGERIRDEFLKVLALPASAHWVRQLDASGALVHVLPELVACHGVEQNEWHHLDVFDHILETLTQLEHLIQAAIPVTGWPQFVEYLAQPIAADRSFATLLKLGCLLHDVGKPACRRVDPGTGKVVFHGHEMTGSQQTQQAALRLKLSVDESRFLCGLVKNHMRPGVLVQEGLTERRLFKYYTETGRDGVGFAVLSLADRLAAQGPNITADELEKFRAGIIELINSFYGQSRRREARPLLSGDDLIHVLRLEPSPLFKHLLAALKEAQFLGEVTDRTTALDWARNWLFKNKPAAD